MPPDTKGRPAVMIVDPDDGRRKQLAAGLARFAYEVVPVAGAEQARLFAAGIGPAVIVARREVPGFGDAAVLPELRQATGAEPLLLILGADERAAEDLPQEVLFLGVAGLEPGEIVRRIRLVLVGREVGVNPDSQLRSLVGDLSLTPVLEIVRAIGRAHGSGRMLLDRAEIVFERGEVVAAKDGKARGVKAFCRVGRRAQGPFRIVLGRPAVEREIDLDSKSLIIQAIEDHVSDPPNPRSRVEVNLGPAFFGVQFTPFQQRVLTEVKGESTVGELLDRLPATDGEILRELAGLEASGAVELREPDARVWVVTDSTADLGPPLAREHGIRVVPLMVRFGDRIFRDGVDISPRQFYELLASDPAHPVSSPPTPGEFRQLYADLAVRRDVVSLHLSSALSETFSHATSGLAGAARELAERRGGEEPPLVEIVDTRQVSLGLGLLALFAARLAHRGWGAREIAAQVQAMSERVEVLFVVDTLEFLARGGRIGKARAWIGGLLGIKPILGVADGVVVPVDQVRGGRRAHPRMIELFAERVDVRRPVIAAVAHANAPVWADRIKDLLESRLTVRECLVGEMGPVVGTHAGPGTVGAAIYQPLSEELELLRPLD